MFAEDKESFSFFFPQELLAKNFLCILGYEDIQLCFLTVRRA